jgi:hypothetical protein
MEMNDHHHPHRLGTLEQVTGFMLAGNATLTVVSKRTGARFTYKVRQAKDNDALYFVALMNGPDNEGDFQYLGTIRTNADGARYQRGRKAKIAPTAPSAKAFDWLTTMLFIAKVLPNACEVWHEGRCGRCGRKLTVPESIEAGLGPECAGKVGAA